MSKEMIIFYQKSCPGHQRLHLWAFEEDFLNLANQQQILKMVFKNCEWHNFWPEHEFLWLMITFDGVEEVFFYKKMPPSPCISKWVKMGVVSLLSFYKVWLLKLIKDKRLTTPIFIHFEMHGLGGIFLLKRIPQHHQKWSLVIRTHVQVKNYVIHNFYRPFWESVADWLDSENPLKKLINATFDGLDMISGKI